MFTALPFAGRLRVGPMRLDLEELLSGIGRPRIAVLGDSMVDEYVWGEVERISPEGPVPVLRVARREHRAGGAGSVVTNLAVLKADVRFFSVRGDDSAGERLVRMLEAHGARMDGVVVEAGRPTTLKARLIGYVQHANRAMQQILRVDEEVKKPIQPKTLSMILERFRAQAHEFDVVLVSDYHKGLISGSLLAAMREAAPRVPFLVDPALREDYSLYRGCNLICPNRYEASRASGLPCEDLAGCARASRKLLEELEIDSIALTMDSEGIYLEERGGGGSHFPTQARVVADVTGAGDMVLSVLGLVVASGGKLAQAVELSNVAAGIEIRKMGVTPIGREEILQELRYEGHPGVSKVRKRDELIPLIQAARESGKKIVFTNGCFDLLHPGHHQLLHGASREGDVLVVAINSDASVKRLKGPRRPKIREEERMFMIASLSCVDYVTSFDEDTPIPLLEALKPDVLVKGAEYKEGVVVGRELVEGWGGRVAFVSQLPGISTTAILEDRLAL